MFDVVACNGYCRHMAPRGKKARIAAVESLKGKDPIAAAISGQFKQPEKHYLNTSVEAQKAMSFAIWRKQRQLHTIVDFWYGLMQKAETEDVTWKASDILKASELLAKHLGMIGGEASTTVNINHFDVKSASARDLVARLEELKAHKELEQAKESAIDVSGNSTCDNPPAGG